MKKKHKIKRNYKKLGMFLAKKRKNAGITQRQVTDALGYSSAQFCSNFERGIAAPPLKKMKTYSKLLKFKKDDMDTFCFIYGETFANKAANYF